MSDDPQKETVDEGTRLARERTELAVTRTIIAAERTLMAWIRTSISLIGFGFTIYKFFDYLRTAEAAMGAVRPHPHAARNLGLTFIVLGTLALVVAAIQHRIFLNEMGVKEGKHLWSLSFIVALFTVVIGIFAFIGVLTGAGPF